MDTKGNKKIARMVFSFSIFLLLIFTLLRSKRIIVQIATPPGGISLGTLTFILIIAVILSLMYLLKDKVYKVIVIGIGTFILFFVFISNGYLTGVEYTTFSSPNKKEKFVVIEKGIGHLYQLSDSGVYMTYLSDINTDDGYKPFSTGAYK